MPRYYFDLMNGGGPLRDEEGIELDGPEDARAFACQSIRDIAAAELRDGNEVRLGHFISIRDIAGAEVGRVLFADAIRIVQ